MRLQTRALSGLSVAADGRVQRVSRANGVREAARGEGSAVTVRIYIVTLMSRDSSCQCVDIEEPAFTAADAITQVELRERGSLPGLRVYRVRPKPDGKENDDGNQE
jgi:hypothetical protein